jgi:hypothetical protein
MIDLFAVQSAALARPLGASPSAALRQLGADETLLIQGGA